MLDFSGMQGNGFAVVMRVGKNHFFTLKPLKPGQSLKLMTNFVHCISNNACLK